MFLWSRVTQATELCLDCYRKSRVNFCLFGATVFYLYLNTNITGKGNVVWLEDMGILGSWLLSSTWVIFIWKSNKTKVITCLMT